MHMSSQFRTARNIISGEGTAAQIGSSLPLLGNPASVLVVTQEAIVDAGLAEAVLQALGQAGVRFTVVDDIGVEPSVENLTRVCERTSSTPVEAVIGIGGGSCLDAAKLISVMRTNDTSLEDMIGTDKVTKPGVPTCLIPTTAGTGSEVTPNAIVTLPEKELKQGVVSSHLLPTVSIVDPELTYSLPRPLTASTGMDAFIHSFESFLSKKANPVSDTFALRSMRLISRSLVTAYKEPGNAQARADMMYGSVFGGMALTGSGTTAVHALAYPLGGKFKIAHGVANAILLPHVFEFNLEAVGSRVDEIAEAMEIDAGSDWRERGRAILDRIRGWVLELELPDDLSRWGVGREDLPVLAHAASQVTRLLVNNPRELSVSDIEEIYAKLLPIGGGVR